MVTKTSVGVTGAGPLTRANHSGEQPISSITGLAAALSAKFPTGYSGKTTTYAVTASDNGLIIGASATGGAFTITLPDVADVPSGFFIVVKKTDTGANAVTIATTAGQTIDGASTRLLRMPQQSVALLRTGATWLVIAEGNITQSGSNPNGDYVRHADGTMHAWGSITVTPVANTLTTGTVTFPLAFASAPKVQTTMNFGSNTQTNSGFQTVTATTAAIAVLRTNTTDMLINWQASGRWY